MWDYGGALIFDGLHQVNRTFGIDYDTIMDDYLDLCIADPLRYGYKILHDIPIPYGEEIGDDLGLFPIAYLNRMLSRANNETADCRIVRYVTEHVLRWPKHLADGTISRDYGWAPGHTQEDADIVWADDQYMGLVLLARLASVTRNETIAGFVTVQALLFARHLTDPFDGLIYHGYNGASKRYSCCKWGRANGWSMISHVEIIQMLDNFPSLKSKKTELLGILSRQAHALLKFQSPDGRFRQVINESRTYLETSSTAMIVTSWARAVYYGWLDTNMYNSAIWRAWNGMLNVVHADGTVDGICIPTG